MKEITEKVNYYIPDHKYKQRLLNLFRETLFINMLSYPKQTLLILVMLVLVLILMLLLV